MKKTVIFLFLILCMTAVNTGCQKKQETDFILENPKEHTDNEKQTEGNKDIKEGKSDSEKEKSTENIFVYVCGAVQKPGVYELLPGQRICDAIVAAGGLSEQAAGDSLNQAEVLSDGQMLRVLTKEEATAATVQPGQETAESSRDGRVDINIDLLLKHAKQAAARLNFLPAKTNKDIGKLRAVRFAQVDFLTFCQ